MSSFHLNRKLL